MTDWELAPEAERDLYLYGVETFGRTSALDYVETLTNCFALLAGQPKMGRLADSVRRGARRFEHRQHVIYYEERGSAIFILAVIHERSIRGLDG